MSDREGSDIDLCYWHEASGLKMMAVTRDWYSTTFSALGAIKNIVPEVMVRYPELFADVKSAQLFFTALHFQNMGRSANSFGLKYPCGEPR